MKSIFQIALLWFVTTQAYALHNYPADQYWLSSNVSNTASIDHSAWQKTLGIFVSTNTESGIALVDYSTLQQTGLSNLNAYLDAMSSVIITNYSRAEQFAFWVNLYNAVTVKLIASNYPVKSIRKLGGWFSRGPWENELITVEGIALSLNDIEHRILRPIWKDYRIHFVVNCASLGCPNLLTEALTAENSERILGSAAKGFIRHSRGVDVSKNGVVTLSKIFDWYAQDFGDSEAEVVSTLSNYLEANRVTSLTENASRVRYQYDWGLNDSAPSSLLKE